MGSPRWYPSRRSRDEWGGCSGEEVGAAAAGLVLPGQPLKSLNRAVELCHFLGAEDVPKLGVRGVLGGF